eukprot:m.46150 g.46150  ORF g.46150 m.46150 type:complete len:220 (+) comp11831_c0_seq1:195-854(+)
MGDAGASAGASPRMYFIAANVGKSANLGTLIRSCVAFGCTELCAVGMKKQLQTFGAHGSNKYIKIKRFDTLEQCKAYLVELSVCVCGVEIVPEAQSIMSKPWQGSTAFMVGNEGSGMTAKQKSICDHFVYIPQYGNGTASLNVTVAASIVLQHFATWAGFTEYARNPAAEKFAITPLDHSTLSEEQLLLREQRHQAAQQLQAAEAEGTPPAFDVDFDPV